VPNGILEPDPASACSMTRSEDQSIIVLLWQISGVNDWTIYLWVEYNTRCRDPTIDVKLDAGREART